MKKIECIIEKRFLESYLHLLDSYKVRGYSVIEIYKGRGPRHGKIRDLGFVSITKNYLVISLCNMDIYQEVKQHAIEFAKDAEALIYFQDIESLSEKP